MNLIAINLSVNPFSTRTEDGRFFQISVLTDADHNLGEFLWNSGIKHSETHCSFAKVDCDHSAHHNTMWSYLLSNLCAEKPFKIGAFSLEDLGFDTSPSSARSPSPGGILRSDPWTPAQESELTIGEVLRRAESLGLKKCPQSLAAGIRLSSVKLIPHSTAVIVTDPFMIAEDGSMNNFNFAVRDQSGNSVLDTVPVEPGAPVRCQHNNAALNRMVFIFVIPENPSPEFKARFENTLCLSQHNPPINIGERQDDVLNFTTQVLETAVL